MTEQMTKAPTVVVDAAKAGMSRCCEEIRDRNHSATFVASRLRAAEKALEVVQSEYNQHQSVTRRIIANRDEFRSYLVESGEADWVRETEKYYRDGY